MFTNEANQVTNARCLRSSTRAFAICLALSIGCASTTQAAISLAPGFSSTVYTSASQPASMTFSPTGEMFVGNNSGGTTDVHIYRVPAGGGIAQFYGDSVIHDPDGVLFDAQGTFSGVPGTVLVGGATPPPGGGLITAVYPDESVAPLIGPSAVFRNPGSMRFDSQQRLLFSDNLADGVFISDDGATASKLISLPFATYSMDVDANDHIFLNAADGTIRIYDIAGTLLDAAFATGLNIGAGIKVGPDNTNWGNNLYVADPGSGHLLRFDSSGSSTVLANGLNGSAYGLQFGPDNALYLSMRDEGQILRIVPEPSTIASLSIFCVIVLIRRPGRNG